MGLKSFHDVETNQIATLPNAMSVCRGVGGVALGVGLATGSIDPAMATISAVALIASDAEGSLISATLNYPRVQKYLRIFPSKAGRALDAATDKMFAISVLAGGYIGGEIPLWQAASIGATELATTTASLIAKLRHREPEASKIGKIGMVARGAVIIADLAASALSPQTSLVQEILVKGSDVLAVAAVGLGAISCGQLVKRAFGPKPMINDSELTPIEE